MKNIVVSCVGKDSLHKKWLDDNCNFDVYLINYGNPGEVFEERAKMVIDMKGTQAHLLYKFLLHNQDLLDQYDYLFFPDDDLLMNSSTINRLFELMEHYHLEIAQPSLEKSYYSWDITLKNSHCKIRYTNFVELMAPCFSCRALKKIMSTFNENSSGYGIEFHWPVLIDSNHRDMAIIDEISIIHTRPVRSYTIALEELSDYLIKYNLSDNVQEYGNIPLFNGGMLLGRAQSEKLLSILSYWKDSENTSSVNVGVNGYFGYAYYYALLAQVTQKQKYVDEAVKIINDTHKYIVGVKNNMTFANGIIGCCYVVEYMVANGLVKNSSSQILSDIDKYIELYIEQNHASLNIDEMCSIIRYYKLKSENNSSKDEINKLDEITKRVLAKIEEKKITDYSLDVAYVLPGLLFKQKKFDVLKKWENSLVDNDMLNLTEIYKLFLIYKQTPKESLLIEIREFIDRMPPRLMNLHDAILICEMLSYNRK